MILLIIGLFIGGFIGVTIMAVLISGRTRDAKYDEYYDSLAEKYTRREDGNNGTM